MNLVKKRRTKTDPAKQRAEQEAVRRRIALAVSIAERKTRVKTRAEVLEAVAAGTR